MWFKKAKVTKTIYEYHQDMVQDTDLELLEDKEGKSYEERYIETIHLTTKGKYKVRTVIIKLK